MKRLLIGVCAGMVFLSATGAFAQETDARGKTQTVDKVVVTAGRVAEKPKTVSAAMTVIPREEIAKYQQQDLGALLRNRGFQVNSYAPGGAQSQVTIRGLRTSLMGDDTTGAVLVLVNGRRAGTDNVSLVPLVNVERVEIVRGPAAVQYGTSAMGGVINIITRRGDDLKAAAELGMGSWQGYKTMAEGSGSGYGFDFSGGVSWVTQNHDYKTGSGYRYDNTDVANNFGHNLNLGYTFMKEHRIGVNYQGVRSHEGSPGDTSVSAWMTPDTRQKRQNQSVDFTYDGGYKNAGLSWTGRYFTGKYKYDYVDSWWSKNENEYQGAQGQLSFAKGPLTLTGGVDWLKYEGKVANPMAVNDDVEQKNLGTFLLAKLGFFEDLVVLSGGVRYDTHNLDYEGRDKDYYRTTPSVGLAVNPLDWLTLRANYAESFRVPQPLAVLGYRDAFGTFVGNPDLDPEKGKTWDIGAEINHKSLNFGLTYFQTDYKNKIISEYLPSGDQQWVNIDGKTKFRGLEGQASYDIGELFDAPFTLRPYVNLTRLFRYKADDGRIVPSVAGTQLAYGLNFNHPDWGLDVDLRLTYYGHQRVSETNYSSSRYGKTKTIGGDTTADLYVSKTIVEGDGGKLSIKGEILNIFDRNYSTIDYYPMPGRSFYVSLRYDY